jgi:hypothetical protein
MGTERSGNITKYGIERLQPRDTIFKLSCRNSTDLPFHHQNLKITLYIFIKKWD